MCQTGGDCDLSVQCCMEPGTVFFIIFSLFFVSILFLHLYIFYDIHLHHFGLHLCRCGLYRLIIMVHRFILLYIFGVND